jgi:methionyl-tRNA formyltransferase
MTGVTIIKLDDGLDTGPVLTAQAIDIGPEENCGTLTRRLAAIGAGLLVSALDDYLAGVIDPVEQSNDGVTNAEKVTASDRPIDPDEDVASVIARIRALAPDPGATLEIMGRTHKVIEASAHESRPPKGTWVVVDGVPVVGVNDGGVALLSIQPPGKTVMDGGAWARGLRESSGVVG